jgi:hypothetical protein
VTRFRPALAIERQSQLLDSSTHHSFNNPPHIFDVEQDVIERNGMVALSVICIRSGQYDQPVHTRDCIGFDGALVKGP